MATSPEAVRQELAVVTTAAAAEIRAVAADLDPDPLRATLDAIGLLVPSYYDAAGTLAVTWYDERRSEAQPATAYAPQIIGDPVTDWIDREVEKMLSSVDFEAETQRLLDEAVALAEKEIARGYRDSITGNTRQDPEAIGWSRVARAGACKLCRMAADRGAVYREETAFFAAHTNCHCAARPEFAGGEHGPEASVEQYLAASKRRTPEQRARLRAHLNDNYPDAPG